MQFRSVDEIGALNDAGHAVGEEVGPGAIVRRRAVLRLGLSGLGLALLGGIASPGCSSSTDGMTRENSRAAAAGVSSPAAGADNFLARVVPEARALIAAPRPDEEAYLASVGALLARVEAPPRWRERSADRAWSMDTIAHYPPVVFLQIEMTPNSVIHLHDHRHYNGILMAVAGSVRCRNFDIVQSDGKLWDISAGQVPPKGEDFLIRKYTDVVLRPGALATLTRDRDNIHHIEAGNEGATLLDFFTHFSPKARSYELEWDGVPYDEVRGLYKVAWKGA